MSSFFDKLKTFIATIATPDSVAYGDYMEEANGEPISIEGEKIYARSTSWIRPLNNMGSEMNNVIGMPSQNVDSIEVIQEIEQIFMELEQSDTRIKNDQADIEKLKVETRSILASLKQF
jgi:hypothetical protein